MESVLDPETEREEGEDRPHEDCWGFHWARGSSI